jgi:NADPH-dependent glutamate synthase beta subunit-like oxidoreductase
MEKNLKGVEIIKNKLGDVDASGRRNPVEIPGSEETLEFDTLIVTIGEYPRCRLYFLYGN